MKLSIILPGALLSAGVIAERSFTQVPLEEPQNWVAGSGLFPSNVIAGYNADFDKYDADSWSEHILEECKSFDQCTSSDSFSGINSGTPKIRYWFGYVYRGGPTTQANYTRADGVQNSTAYTIVED